MRHFFLLTLVCYWSSILQGQIFATDMGVKAQSFGGAYRALASHEEVIFYNPAGLIKKRRTGSDIFYQWATESQFHQFGVTLGDAQTTSWGLGLGYVAGIDNKTDKAANHLVTMALAMPIVTDMFVLGTSFSYWYDEAFKTDLPKHFFNVDVGFLVNAPLGLSFAMVADHILAPKDREKALGLSVAAAFDMGKVVEAVPLSISFDWSMDDVKSAANLRHVVAAGMQYDVLSMLPFRVGFKSIIKTNDNFLSLGTGISSDKMALDGVYQQHLTIGKIRHFGIALNMRM